MKRLKLPPMGVFHRGIPMEQHKEPALSQPLDLLTNTPEPQRMEGQPVYPDLEHVEPFEIIRAAKAAGIIDERDGLPLFKKLKACVAKGVFIRVDAVDDEPYLSSQLGPLLRFREECVSGLRLACKAITAADSGIIEVYRNMADLEIKIPRSIEGIRVRRIGGFYPTEIRSGYSLVEEEGKRYLYLGSCALIHLHRAVFQGLAQTTAFLTVGGNCVAHPCNLEVSLGLPVTDVLDRCGLTETPTRVVVGGSMTGQSVSDTDKALVTVTTRGVLAFRDKEQTDRSPCIRCGRCVQVCPMGLNPMMLYRSIQQGLEWETEALDYKHCIECMCCSFECPARLEIAEAIKEYRRGRRSAT